MALDERDIALAVQKFMAIHPLVVKKKKKNVGGNGGKVRPPK